MTKLTLDEFIVLRRCANGHLSSIDRPKTLATLREKGLVRPDNTRLTRAGLKMLSLAEARLARFFELLTVSDEEFEKWLIE